MAVQSSGVITLNDVNTEFVRGSGATLAMSQLYRGGGIIPNATVNNNVPTSGVISMSNLYGATRRIALSYTVPNNSTDLTIGTSTFSGYVAGVSDLTITIPSGYLVGGTVLNGYALTVANQFSTGDTITLVNGGSILGRGGTANSGAGSNALQIATTNVIVTIQNNGTIGGGGGGGGYGAYVYGSVTNKVYNGSAYGAGGGGGGGRGWGSAAGGTTYGSTSGTAGIEYNASAGTAGSTSSVGTGGVGGVGYAVYTTDYYVFGGSGGSGGSLGASGASGTAGGGRPGLDTFYAVGSQTSGGAAGIAIKGVGKYSLSVTGTILGATVA